MAESNTSPIALKAKNYKRLERLMLVNNVRRGAFHKYQIVWDGKEWFAWFYADQSRQIRQVENEILRNGDDS